MDSASPAKEKALSRDGEGPGKSKQEKADSSAVVKRGFGMTTSVSSGHGEKPGRSSAAPLRELPVELQSELELTRVVSRSSLAGIGPELVDRGDVDAVGDVEHVDD